jgi:hypothetical protein
MASPFTVVKGDEFNRLTPAGIIRCLQGQDPLAQSTASAVLYGLKRLKSSQDTSA